MSDFESEGQSKANAGLGLNLSLGLAPLQQFAHQVVGSTMQDQSLQIQSLSPIALAYVGDAVYELYIRTQLLWPPQRPQAYHDAVVTQVRAEQQATSLERLQPYLNEIEQAMVRKGRNAAPKRQRRVRADTYQRATSFETLIGYLYLTDPSRLFELLNQLNKVQS